MDKRQKKWQKAFNKGVKAYEYNSDKAYDYYGKASRRRYLDLDEPVENGRKGCFVGCLKFFVILIIIALVIYGILFFTYYF